MEILFVSDYVCPYCLVAKQALRLALERTGIAANITWQPYELTREPEPRVDTYHDDRRKAHYQVLVEPCRAMGLDMKLPPNVVPRPYSRLAFEGYHYARVHSKGEAYNDLVYRAYFIQERDIGDPAVLAELAAQAGLDRQDFLAALREGRYAQQQAQARDYSRDVLKVRHVPTIYLDGQELTLNAYTPEELTQLLIDHTATFGPGNACDIHGC